MFRRLRLRLTALYLGAALLVLAVVSGAAYGLLQTAFQSTTDLALRYELAQEFRGVGAPLPPDLAAAVTAWSAAHAPPTSGTPRATPVETAGETEGAASTDRGDRTADGGTGTPPGRGLAALGHPGEGSETADSYDAELASIFVLPLDVHGAVLARLSAAPSALQPDRAAALTALSRGSDWRTVRVGGRNTRLASYRIRGPGGLAVLQAVRTLGDQAAVLQQLVVGLLVLGAVATLGLGAGSWWLAGRSLRPAQESWQRQQSFVANASHELRAPLTLLRASAEVTRRHLPAGDARGRALLDDVLGECDHMARLVEDLLVLSRLDAGALVLQCEVLDVAPFLADVARQVGPVADARGVRVQVEAGAAGAIGTVWADSARLRQIVLILLDNALRYTPAGGTVRLDARPRGRQVAITVADTGAGIAAEHLPHLFERFYRVDQARSSSPEGSGLGLAIAHALVTAHRGEIHVSSQLGVGTTITVTLPVPSSHS